MSLKSATVMDLNNEVRGHSQTLVRGSDAKKKKKKSIGKILEPLLEQLINVLALFTWK